MKKSDQDRLFAKQCEILGQAYSAAIAEMLEKCQNTESPIENLLMYGMQLWNKVNSNLTQFVFWNDPNFTNFNEWVEFEAVFSSPDDQRKALYVATQVDFNGVRRSDFVVAKYVRVPGGAKILSICIECDGFDWHDKEKSAFERDRLNDRILHYTGTPVIRFAGTEIWRDTLCCVRQIINLINKISSDHRAFSQNSYDRGFGDGQEQYGRQGRIRSFRKSHYLNRQWARYRKQQERD